MAADKGTSKSKKSSSSEKSSKKKGRKLSKRTKVAAAATGAAVAAVAAGAVVRKVLSGHQSTYHVSPSGDRWEVRGDGAKRASSLHDTKKEAVDTGRSLAKKRAPSELIVHRKDGTVQDSFAYSKDEGKDSKGD